MKCVSIFDTANSNFSSGAEKLAGVIFFLSKCAKFIFYNHTYFNLHFTRVFPYKQNQCFYLASPAALSAQFQTALKSAAATF